MTCLDQLHLLVHDWFESLIFWNRWEFSHPKSVVETTRPTCFQSYDVTCDLWLLPRDFSEFLMSRVLNQSLADHWESTENSVFMLLYSWMILIYIQYASRKLCRIETTWSWVDWRASAAGLFEISLPPCCVKCCLLNDNWEQTHSLLLNLK